MKLKQIPFEIPIAAAAVGGVYMSTPSLQIGVIQSTFILAVCAGAYLARQVHLDFEAIARHREQMRERQAIRARIAQVGTRLYHNAADRRYLALLFQRERELNEGWVTPRDSALETLGYEYYPEVPPYES